MTATDFHNHHIEGYAHAAIDRGWDGSFNVPMISEILPNLWMGGCMDGLRLTDDFEFVLSLYPWEKYTLGPATARLEVKLYDAGEMPDLQQLHDLAATVNTWRAKGKTLVHCQAGLNRSGLVTALALAKGGMSPSDAIALLREKRCDMVLCNETFETWLRCGVTP